MRKLGPRSFVPKQINVFNTILLCFFFLLAAGSRAVMAQATTTQFASGVATPQGGLVLSGSAINPVTGRPFRYLWSADATNGLCRLDPDIDTIAPHAINPATCLTSVVGGVAFSPGQLTLDPATNTIYAIDGGGKLGIFVLHFLPTGDSGNGLIDTVNQEVLGGSGTGTTAASGCGIATGSPNSTTLGPDGSLYVGFRRSGNIMRIIAPLTSPLPCANVQPVIAQSPDLKLTSQMAFIGHDLFANDSRGPFVVLSADQCFTPQNGFISCPASASGIFSVAINASTTVVGDQTPGLLNGINLYFGMLTSVGAALNADTPNLRLVANYGGTSFQIVSALAVDTSDPANSTLYVGDDPSNGLSTTQGRWWQVLAAPPAPAPPSAPLNVTATGGNAQATVSWNAPLSHQPVTSYTVHALAANGTVLPDVVVNAPTGTTLVPTTAIVTGLTNGVSYQFEVLASNAQGSSAFSAPSNAVTPQAPTVPGAPTGVEGSASNATVLLIWSAPASNGGSPITSYTATAYVGGVPVGITATASGSATGVAVTGLTNGTAYTFTVHATNALGNSPESAPSAPVTPTTVTVPGAPTGVAGLPGDTQVTVFWGAPASDGGSPITSYTVSTYIGGVPTGVPVTVAGTSALITGLTDGIAYTFTVHAGNAVGTGPESAPSSPVVPIPPPPDMAITMNGPASVIAGNSAVYTLNVANLGPSTASGVTLVDSETGATISSVSTTLGTCTTFATSGTITCNLGTMLAGGSAVITVTLKPSAQTTNQATVQASANSGADPNPNNNTASVTTTFIPLAQTTAVQVVGSAQNGGPSVTGTDTFTWQIKNNQSLTANAVHFTSTLAAGMVFQSVSSNVGACTAPAAGTAGATLTCDLASLSGGQTMIVTVNVTFNATGTMSTSGQVTFNGTDNNPANNQTSITIGVK